MSEEFDLTPNPRVLQMLGEIDLPQWRCIAELVDNSIDGFLQAARSGAKIDQPAIEVALPMADTDYARVSVKDNGPGMSFETLENAVTAGWSGNSPVGNLGLFGMGFNIATARLGLVTEVWTSRKGEPEQVGVRIDFDELRATNSFRVPRQTRPKLEHSDHGTEVVITKLKPDQRAYLYRGNNQKTIRKWLARVYSSLLTQTPAGAIRLAVNGAKVWPRLHCVWREDRAVAMPDGSAARVVEKIDVPLAPRRYCVHCMRTLAADETECPTRSPSCMIVEQERRIHGWIGLQRYLHGTEYGLDFIRNGRKIEMQNKDLFEWKEGETTEVEYPTDDQRGRGRFVGEIHIDHCRVSYTKDRFERDDPAWAEMVRVIRGEGPLRPQVAKNRGYQANGSPLYGLYQAFRRSSPQGKNGLWSRVLVVRDNERAQAMAEKFADGEAEYLSDEPWWKLVEEQDAEILSGAPGDPPADAPPGFLDPNAGSAPTPSVPTPVAAPAPPPRRQLHELSRHYLHPTFRVDFDVQAFSVELADPDLPAGLPWALKLESAGGRLYAFLVNLQHEIFRSTTMTPLDGLLTELTFRALEFLKGQSQEATTAGVIADFRKQYCAETRLDPQEIISLATQVLSDIARAIPSLMTTIDGDTLHAELSEEERAAVARRMANRGVPDRKSVISQGRFWEFADVESIRRLFNRRPDLFLDGHYWDDDFANLDFGDERVTQSAREATRARYDAYLGDVIWLANQTALDIERTSRDVIVRATCSVRLLRADRVE